MASRKRPNLTADQRDRVERICAQAIELSAHERDEFIARQCGGDEALRHEVMSRLNVAEARHGAGAAAVDPLKRGEVSTADDAGAAAAPEASLRMLRAQMIGPYRLLSVLGEGGFGVVYLAERREPHVQRVALKVIKPGMDSRAVLARFEQERQALAVMDHPNVARVFDGGVTEQGRPYFVMEHVRGEAITAYCDRERLPIEARLELFVPVCEAVQHAHMKGIIHRDLKPSNVLVEVVDGRAIPKVIDFGVAKAISQTLTEKTIFTEQGQLIGTPEYMSPEQAEMGATDIDTRTDVYSLGVILYELLTGALPFDKQTLRSAGFGEIQRIIREVEPPRPSTRVSSLGAGGADVAGRRGTGARELAGALRRELEWIPLKAMRKDRTQRYATAADLARDIGNFTAGRPLVAGPESAAYRARKLLRRNRGAAMACAAVVAALLAGLAGTLWQAHAASAQRDAAIAAGAEAERRADELERVSDFQAQMLRQVDPAEAGRLLSTDVRARFEEALTKEGVGADERAGMAASFADQWRRVNATDAARDLIDRTILKPAVEAIETQFKGQPLVDASLRTALASLYRNLGLYGAAAPLQQRALDTRRRALGEEHPLTLAALADMGNVLRDQGKLDEAEPMERAAMEGLRRVSGEEDRNTLSAIGNYAALLRDRGMLNEAEPYYREVLEKRRRTLGEEHPKTLLSLEGMSQLLQDLGRLSEAETYCREALEKKRRVLGEAHRQTLISINNMGLLLHRQGRLREAEPYCREAVEKQRAVLGEEHPNTLTALNNLAQLLQDLGRFSEAEAYCREALEKRRRVLGEEHPQTLVSISNMGSLLQEMGRLAEAEPYYREALEKQRRLLGNDHRNTFTMIANMGRLLNAQGKREEAERYLRESLEGRRRALGDEHPSTLSSMMNLGDLLVELGRQEEAASYYRAVGEHRRRVLGGDDPRTLTAINSLGVMLRNLGRLDEAAPLLQEAMEGRRRVLGEEHLDTLSSIIGVGALRIAQGDAGAGAALLEGAEPAARKVLTSANNRVLGMFLMYLGNARAGLGAFSPAEANLLEAHSLLVKARGAGHGETRACEKAIAELYTAWDHAESGKGHGEKAAEWSERAGAGAKAAR